MFFTHFTALTELFTTASMAMGELFSITAILFLLNGLSKAIKVTFTLGLWTGWFYKAILTPAILWTADHISLINSYIDWQQVGSVLLKTTAYVTAGLITVYEYSMDKLTTTEYTLRVYNTPLTTGLA